MIYDILKVYVFAIWLVLLSLRMLIVCDVKSDCAEQRLLCYWLVNCVANVNIPTFSIDIVLHVNRL